MTMTLDAKEYMRRSRDKRQAQGGKQVAVMLTPEEVAALEKLKAKLGLNARDTIGKALLDAARRAKI